MSASPAVGALSSVTPVQRQAMSKSTAQTMERLVLSSCRKEAAEALKDEGEKTLEASFNTLGEVAMRELTADPSVAAEFESLNSFIDKERWEAFGAEVTG